jgi:hypothetical protein
MKTAAKRIEKPAPVAHRWQLRKGAVEWYGCLLDPVTASEACRIFKADFAEPVQDPQPEPVSAAQEAELRELVHSVIGDCPEAEEAVSCGLHDIEDALTSWRLLAKDHAEREEWQRTHGRA